MTAAPLEVPKVGHKYRVTLHGGQLNLYENPGVAAMRLGRLRRGEQVELLSHSMEGKRRAVLKLRTSDGVEGYLNVRGRIGHLLEPEVEDVSPPSAPAADTGDLATSRPGLPRLYHDLRQDTGGEYGGRNAAGGRDGSQQHVGSPGVALSEWLEQQDGAGSSATEAAALPEAADEEEVMRDGLANEGQAAGADMDGALIEESDQALLPHAEILQPRVPPVSLETLHALASDVDVTAEDMTLALAQYFAAGSDVTALPADLTLQAASKLLASPATIFDLKEDAPLFKLAVRLADEEAVPLTDLLHSAVPRLLAMRAAETSLDEHRRGGATTFPYMRRWQQAQLAGLFTALANRLLHAGLASSTGATDGPATPTSVSMPLAVRTDLLTISTVILRTPLPVLNDLCSVLIAAATDELSLSAKSELTALPATAALVPADIARQVLHWPVLLVEMGLVWMPPSAPLPPHIIALLQNARDAAAADWEHFLHLSVGEAPDAGAILGLSIADVLCAQQESASPFLDSTALPWLSHALERHAMTLPWLVTGACLWTLAHRRSLMAEPVGPAFFTALQEAFTTRDEAEVRRLRPSVAISYAWAAKRHGALGASMSALPPKLRTAALAGRCEAPYSSWVAQKALQNEALGGIPVQEPKVVFMTSDMPASVRHSTKMMEIMEDAKLIEQHASRTERTGELSDSGVQQDAYAKSRETKKAKVARRLHLLQVEQRLRCIHISQDQQRWIRERFIATLARVDAIEEDTPALAELKDRIVERVRRVRTDYALKCTTDEEAEALDALVPTGGKTMWKTLPMSPPLRNYLQRTAVETRAFCMQMATELSDRGYPETGREIRRDNFQIVSGDDDHPLKNIRRSKSPGTVSRIRECTQRWSLKTATLQKGEPNLDQMLSAMTIVEMRAVARYLDLPASQSKKRLKETLLSVTSLSHENIKLAICGGFHLHLIGRHESREPRAHEEEEDLDPYSE